MATIYLDNSATTRVDPLVLEAMLPFLRDEYGNASSLHGLGLHAAQALEAARAEVAALLGSDSPRELVFNSGATEGNQTAIHAALAGSSSRRKIVTTAVEHSAVLEPLERCRELGFDVHQIGVEPSGALRLDALLDAIDEETALVSVMWANNETGIVHPIAAISERCLERGALLHVDAAQAAGKVPVDVRAIAVDYCSISAHKFHGPKGVGALYVRGGAPFRPWQTGGGQELERRAGTENIPGICGLGEAARLARGWLAGPGPAELAQLRAQLECGLLEGSPGVHAHGASEPRLPTTSSLRFDGLSGEALVILMSEEGICASTGAACSAGRQAPSHVLLAMGESPRAASSTVRFSLSRENTEAEIAHCCERVPELARALRDLAGTIH